MPLQPAWRRGVRMPGSAWKRRREGLARTSCRFLRRTTSSSGAGTATSHRSGSFWSRFVRRNGAPRRSSLRGSLRRAAAKCWIPLRSAGGSATDAESLPAESSGLLKPSSMLNQRRLNLAFSSCRASVLRAGRFGILNCRLQILCDWSIPLQEEFCLRSASALLPVISC